MYRKQLPIVLALLACSSAALATGVIVPPPDPQPISAEAAALAAAEAAAAAESAAQAAAEGGAGGAGGSASAVGGAGQGVGTVGYQSDFKSLALGLPGQTAAPAVGGHPCLEHTRGGSGLSIGVSGRTRFNRDCMEFERAKLLMEAGRADLAVLLLYPNAPKAPEPPPAAIIFDPERAPTCAEHATRVLEACNSK